MSSRKKPSVADESKKMRLSVHDEHKNFVVTSERASILRSYSNLSTSRLPPIDLNFRQ